MKVLFWIPCKDANLFQLVRHFERRPVIVTTCHSEECLAGTADYLADWYKGRAVRRFKSSYRPRFLRGPILGEGEYGSTQLVRPLDRKSVYFFLEFWETNGGAQEIFSMGGNIAELADIVWRYDNAYVLGESDEAIMRDFVQCCRFVVLLDVLFDIDHGVAILSEDEMLLQQMFNYLVALGEPGFTYDSSPEAKERRRRMARREPGGVYLDEFPGGFVYWDTGES